MRRQVWTLALLAAVAAIATSTASLANERLVGTTWRAVEIQGGSVLDEVRSDITIGADGKISGSAACNRMFGTYTIEGNNISFPPMGATRMACARPVMRQEYEFLRALIATRSFSFDKTHLVFRNAAGAEVIRFVAQQ